MIPRCTAFALPAALAFCLGLAACGGAEPSAAARADATGAEAFQPPESLETGVVPAPGPKAATPMPAPGASDAPIPHGPASISRELAEGGSSLRVLVEGLRRGDEVIAIALNGPGGERAAADPAAIRTGTRMSGGSDRPRVSIQGGSDDPLGVTLMMDVFSTRQEQPEERESGLAWAFLPLPDPPAYAADPSAWQVVVTLQDEVGNRMELKD